LRDGIIWLNNEDIAIYTTADNYIEWAIASTGTYEDEIGKLIKISLKDGDTALDIGGNIGLQSIRMAKCVGQSGRVYAFEPLTHLQKKFKKNISLNKVSNVTLFPYALADAAGEVDLPVNSKDWNQGAFSLDGANSGSETQQVIIKKADDMDVIESLTALHLIKIDVEGYEYHVLRGLQQTLAKHRPRIIFEYDDNYWAKTGQKMTECYNYLTQLNYTLYQITPVGCQLINNASAAAGGNIFCIPSVPDEEL
jgi:FkbM family methyltransferase